MNKVAVITGANRGLGLALIKQFISNQWDVVSLVRKDKDEKRIRKLPNCFPIVSDITSNGVQSALSKSLKNIGSVDVLINNAGIPGNGAHFNETSPDDVLSLIDVHCLGVIRVTQAVMPYLAEDGIIINISSRFGSISKVSKGELDDLGCSYSYRIAKAAQNMFTQCMCREFINIGIKICSIHPGRLKTASASADADKTPEEAAQKLFEMLTNIEHGKFYSLFEKNFDW